MDRHFTLQEANRLIPWLRQTMDLALQLQGLVRASLSELADLGTIVGPELLADTRLLDELLEDDDEETAEALRRAQVAYQALRETIERVEKRGVLVKGIDPARLDFLSFRDDGVEVLLCWSREESEITHYHPSEEGFAGRVAVAGLTFFAERPAAPVAELVPVETVTRPSV